MICQSLSGNNFLEFLIKHIIINKYYRKLELHERLHDQITRKMLTSSIYYPLTLNWTRKHAIHQGVNEAYIPQVKIY